MIRKFQTYANTAKYFVRSQYHKLDLDIPFVSSNNIGRVDEERFDNILSQYDDDVVFVHAGLSDVKSAFRTNPYELLLDKLDEHFKSILAPGFTPSFRSTGIYHKKFSRPEVGTFSRLFLEDADYRTNDAIHSILVRGDYRFSDVDHSDSFGQNGCWSKLDEDNVLYLNVGTPWIISSQIHFIENLVNPPYNKHREYEGVIYHSERKYERKIQKNYTTKWPVKWNRSKIYNHLKNENVLHHYQPESLNIMSFSAREMRNALEPEIKADPYYLVK